MKMPLENTGREHYDVFHPVTNPWNAMQNATLTLPGGRTIHYHIRHSKRAKYMRMQLSADKGLVVTQPAGVCEHVLQDWVASKGEWISRKLEEMQQRSAESGQASAGDTLPPLPEQIHLPSLNETLLVKYIKTPMPRIAADYTDHNTVTLSGAVDNQGFCLYVLQRWLQSYAKYQLGWLLTKLSEETGLHYNNYRVKNQKTRWGSCSSKGNINLNYKLLVMPERWARYTMIHELCHTVELNHSERFWALVKKFVPDYQIIEKEMKQAHQALPAWINYEYRG